MPANYEALLQYSFLNNTFEAYLAALGVGVAVWVGLWIFRSVVLRRLRRLSKLTETDLDDLLVELFRSFNLPFYLLLAVGAGAQFILWPSFVSAAGFWAAAAILFYAGVRSVTRLVDYLFKRVAKKRLQEDANFDPSAVRLLARALNAAVWVVALLLLAQNAGYDITALVAGLGIGGLAVAFALQNVLSDVFASFSIYFDKPFETGDFIVVGEDMGTVRRIGLKSTRIESLWGEEIVLPNKALTEARIHNYRKLEKRRVVFSFGIAYETAGEKLRKIPGIIKETVEGIELTAFDRAHFKEFGDSSLNYEVVYYAETTDYNTHMNIQQEIYLRIKERLEKEGIEFAYPTRTVYLRKE